MSTISFFYFMQAFATSLFLVLATYVAMRHSKSKLRAVALPFVIFAVLEAFEAGVSIELFRPEAVVDDIPFILRLRWAFGILIPSIFLQMGLPFLEGKYRRIGKVALVLSYIISGIFSFLALFTNRLLTGAFARGVGGAWTIGPIFDPDLERLVVIWSFLFLLIIATLLALAWKQGSRSNLRADAGRLLLPWILFILSGVSGALAITVEASLGTEFSLILGILQRVLMISVGLVFAHGILAYGSPVGIPVDFQIGSLLLPLLGLLSIDIFLVLGQDAHELRNYRLFVLIVSIMIGLLLAQPPVLRRLSRASMPVDPSRTRFMFLLRAGWEDLARNSFDLTRLSELLIALQEELNAEFIGLLEWVDNEKTPNFTFGKWGQGPRIELLTDEPDWPLTEDSYSGPILRTEGLPGPASLIVPVQNDDGLTAVIVLGEPNRGGTYSSAEIILIEQFSNLLSFAISNGLNLKESPAWVSESPSPQIKLPDTPVTIRAFGQLDVFVKSIGNNSPPRPSLRARQILAHLLISYPGAIPGEVLMENLWPDGAPNSAANNLYVAVYSLRRSLEPSLRNGSASNYIVRKYDAYSLVLNEDLWIDSFAFQDLYRRGRAYLKAGQTNQAIQLFDEAMRIYRAPLLEDISLDLPSKVEVVRHRFHRQFLEIAWQLTNESIQKKRWGRAEQALIQILQLDPIEDEARSRLAEIYREQGKVGLAIEVESQMREG
jgi:DNA-binding SARP family transcriptional activator